MCAYLVKGHAKRLTSVSPFSFVRFGGIPSTMAVSKTCLFPSRAALYICAASLMASSEGEKAVADVSCEFDMFDVMLVASAATFRDVLCISNAIRD